MREVRGEYERCGVRVITYDRPGYGRSTRLKGRSVADAAGDVVAIADHLGLDQFGVIGVSGGGPHTLAVAAKAPERVTRCATIVTGAPYDADSLNYFAETATSPEGSSTRLLGATSPWTNPTHSSVGQSRAALRWSSSPVRLARNCRAQDPGCSRYVYSVRHPLAVSQIWNTSTVVSK
jgi:pimeloyl-ACP methyl ester carboxylesterase